MTIVQVAEIASRLGPGRTITVNAQTGVAVAEQPAGRGGTDRPSVRQIQETIHSQTVAHTSTVC